MPRPRGLPPRALVDVAARLGLPAPAVTPAGAATDARTDAAPGGVGTAGCPPVTGVCLDSRAVRPGDLYAALPGARAHGLDFLPEALSRGAVAVLADRPAPAPVPVLVCPDPRARLGELAAWVYGDPSRSMRLLAVTGTNGKTTTAYLLEAGLAAAGALTGLLGTVENRVGGQVLPAARTTPEAPDLQALLAVMLERGVTAGVMEVSSHALALGRVDGTVFTVGIFTNLSQDHLDFHPDMEAYFDAKASLFRAGRVGTAVVNIDDEWGRRLLDRLDVPWITVSAAGDPAAHWRADQVQLQAAGSRFQALGPDERQAEVQLQLPGHFNVANALAALAALVAAGVDLSTAAAGVSGLAAVPGRLERIEAGQPFAALVDYAHTPEAVASVLAALRPVTPGRLVVVLGCGGDRDRAKRPLMARAAVAGADLAVFTSDNPRSEPPAQILDDMIRDLPVGGWCVEEDRRDAVARAVRGRDAGDTVLVAGKGHETGQEALGVVTPFDDREVLRAALVALAGAAAC